MTDIVALLLDDTMPAERLGELLRAARKRRGWKRARAAKAVGITPKRIRAYEQGTRPIPADVCARLADAYGDDLTAHVPLRVPATRDDEWLEIGAIRQPLADMSSDEILTTFVEVVRSAEDAYAQAGIKDARQELAMAEVHDCFTPTELVLMEDLGFAARGTGWKEVLAGTFDLDGELAVNPDGGLKSFGHPIGASGLRMLFECWLQLRGEAGQRQIASVARGRNLALTHNLGGAPGECSVT